MKVTGAVFRAALSGKHKGELCVRVKGTDRHVFVTKEDMAAFAEENA